MVIETTLGGIRLTLVIAGLVGLACSSALAAVARRRGGPWPSRARGLGAVGAMVGWLLFWWAPSFDGHLASPALLIVAIAYPMVAVESGRGLAFRVFSWTALFLFVAGSVAGVVLPISSRNIASQEGLLALGVIVPPVAGLLSLPSRWAYRRLRLGRGTTSTTRGRTPPFGADDA